ncbi:phosphoglycerate kinase family [Cryptosporidium sp. chipmunk genotype I]|uniref:phosphoglycerate kinase family n=1 Tax=Cryptosporidium sp. chipmunk genotype I TaxID=1280935 RepID=UPI00351A86C8|nr:phosphoglycerate kinase family [Cryptosporidium sp. chipmunk genotype I]
MANHNQVDWEIVGIFDEDNAENNSKALEFIIKNCNYKNNLSLKDIEGYFLDPNKYSRNTSNHNGFQTTVVLTRSWICKLYILSGITGKDLSVCMNCLDNLLLNNNRFFQLNHAFCYFKNLPDLISFPLSQCKFERYLAHLKNKISQKGEIIEKVNTLIKKCLIHLFSDFGGKPNIILIAGTSGSGKSTISSNLASFLRVKCVISTDTIRHVLRSTEKYRHNKALNCSTYEVHKYTTTQPTQKDKDESSESSVVLGYLIQSSIIEDYIYEIIENFVNKEKSIIVEGVHITPSLFERIQSLANLKHANLSTFLIYIQDSNEHIQRFEQRSKGILNSKYHSNIENIREIQSYLIKTIGKLPSVTSIDNTSNNIDNIVQEKMLEQITLKFL